MEVIASMERHGDLTVLSCIEEGARVGNEGLEGSKIREGAGGRGIQEWENAWLDQLRDVSLEVAGSIHGRRRTSETLLLCAQWQGKSSGWQPSRPNYQLLAIALQQN